MDNVNCFQKGYPDVRICDSKVANIDQCMFIYYFT